MTYARAPRRGLFRRFRRRTDGAVAVEMALIAPVMIFMLFGTIELTDGILAKRRLYMGAGMLGDLMTNRAENYVHEDELDAGIAITERVLEPYGLDDATIMLTAVTWDEEKKQPVVVWSRLREPGQAVRQNDEDGYAEGDVFERLRDDEKRYMTSGEQVVQAGDHVVIAEITYPFTSSLSNVVFESFQMEVQEVRVPRRNRTLAFCQSNKPGADCTDGRDWDEGKGEPGEMEEEDD